MLEVLDGAIRHDKEMKGIVRKEEAKVCLLIGGIIPYENLQTQLEIIRADKSFKKNFKAQNYNEKNAVTFLYITNNHFDKKLILTIVALSRNLRIRVIKEVKDHHTANFKILKKKLKNKKLEDGKTSHV